MKSNQPTAPEQAWAHKYKLVDMKPHGEAKTTTNALDRFLIHEAFARFGIAHDEGRMDVLTSLFSADAELSVAEGKAPFQVVRGRETLIRNFANVFSQQSDQRRHCMTNIIIEGLSDDAAEALAYGIVPVAADGIHVGVSVFYSASLRKEADRVWRFSRLFIGMDSYSGQKPKV